jgi:hypothetical protein
MSAFCLSGRKAERRSPSRIIQFLSFAKKLVKDRVNPVNPVNPVKMNSDRINPPPLSELWRGKQDKPAYATASAGGQEYLLPFLMKSRRVLSPL